MTNLPEGRKPLTWSDMDFALPKGHPSSFEAECKQLRAENERLRRAIQAAHTFAAAGSAETAAKVLSDALREGEPNCPQCGLPHPAQNPYCFCKSEGEG